MIAFTEKLSHANIGSLDRMKCLEIGAGFIHSDALCMYLLGASTVFTTDYNAFANFRLLGEAIKNLDADVIVRRLLNLRQ